MTDLVRVDEAEVGGERASVLLADVRHLLQRLAQIALRRKVPLSGRVGSPYFSIE